MTSRAVDMADEIRTQFVTLVATPEGITVQQDNVTGSTLPPDATWCRFIVQHGQCQQISRAGAGQRRHRTTGIALAQVFTPIGAGDAAPLAILARAQDAFRNLSIADPQITFQSPYVVAQPVRDEGWWLTVIAIPYLADDYS